MQTKSMLRQAFDRIEGKHAIKTGVVAALSLIAGTGFAKIFDHPAILLSGTWTTLSAVVVMQAHLGGTYLAAFQRFLGTFIGSLSGSVFTYYLGSHPLALGLSVCATTIICCLLHLQNSIRIANLSVAIIVITSSLEPDTGPFVFGFFRFIDASLGILIAVSIAHSLFPSQARMKLRYRLAETILSLSRLFRLVTRPQSDDPQKTKTLERIKDNCALLLEQNKQLLQDSKLEILSRSQNIEDWEILIRYLQTIFDALTILAQIDKQVLFQIMDHDLKERLNELLDAIERTLFDLASVLEKNLLSPSESVLKESQKNLKEELLRFRSTRTTASFPFKDVEQYFVYFYQLHAISSDLIQIETKVDALQHV